MKDFGLNLFRNYYHEGREEHEEKQKMKDHKTYAYFYGEFKLDLSKFKVDSFD